MVIKAGRFGRFVACTGYPKCRTTHPLKNTENGADSSEADVATDEVCDQCGKPMVIKTGRFGKFMACTGYPVCKATRPMKTGAICPKCGGDIVERRSRGRGRSFYGCSKYPDCDFISNRKPVLNPCPECSGMMVESGRNRVSCSCLRAWTEAAVEQNKKAQKHQQQTKPPHTKQQKKHKQKHKATKTQKTKQKKKQQEQTTTDTNTSKTENQNTKPKQTKPIQQNTTK
ncbi:Uncharacterized protein YrdD [Geodia barretti]|uniref:Uncharacterized protein YrdD n=1 Tax=Geodia barretti TaxID=519541 RepID=A0AA35T1F7_GEOBA|nr:Uncharacterized protein YrdD [Geodia barretti]